MAIYHLNVSTGSKGGGQSAAAKSDYIEREEKYAKGKEEIAHIEHGNMPEFAQNNPREYWQAADKFERSNARLFRQIEFALPIELSLEQQIVLAHKFATTITGKEAMPYTLAIHKGEYDHQGKKTDTSENPHVHLIISERANDGITRDAEMWFKRANKQQPEKGGAAKSKSMESRDWLMETRKLWATMANEALEHAGKTEKIDHRTLEAQGITDRLPQTHRGTAGHLAKRQISTERMARFNATQAQNRALKALSQQAQEVGEELKKTKRHEEIISSAYESLQNRLQARLMRREQEKEQERERLKERIKNELNQNKKQDNDREFER